MSENKRTNKNNVHSNKNDIHANDNVDHADENVKRDDENIKRENENMTTLINAQSLEIDRLYKKTVDAAVQITTIHLKQSRLATQPKQSIETSSGFLYSLNGRIYIITCAHCVLLHAVNEPVDKIYVSVQNINGVKDDNRTFEALIVGVDPIADIAVCRFTCNSFDPPVHCKHETLRFADNRLEKNGGFCFSIGDPLGLDPSSIVTGCIRDKAFNDPSGHFLLEQVTTNILAYPAASGSPVCNYSGDVISLISWSFTLDDQPITNTEVSHGSKNNIAAGFGGGTASHIFRPIIHNIIQNRRCTELNVNGKEYLSYNKCYLAIDNTWGGVSGISLANSVPNKITELPTKGFFVYPLEDSLFNNPEQGDRIKFGDIILAIKDIEGKWQEVDQYSNQAMYNIIYQYNPAKNYKVAFKFISDPTGKAEIKKSKFLLNVDYPIAHDVVPNLFLL